MEKEILQKVKSHPALRKLRTLLREKGDVFLAGGALRDFAMGLDPVDIDLVSKDAAGTAEFLAGKLGSNSFMLGKGVNVIYRIPLEKGSIDISPLSGRTIRRNLMKRDFSVNSIGMDLKTMEISDPACGLKDLENGLLRMGYEDSFRDDPLRILKGYRMRASFPALKWERAARLQAKKLSPSIKNVAAERVQMELVRILIAERSAPAVREMAEDGMLFELFPTLRCLEGLEQPPPHKSDALAHTIEMLELLDENLSVSSGMSIKNHSHLDLLKLRLAVLFHDSGKAGCVSEDDKGLHFYGHEKASSRIAREELTKFKFSGALTADVTRLVELHMRPLLLFRERSVSMTAKRRLIRDADADLPLLLLHSSLDFSSMERRQKDLERYFEFCAELFSLFEEEGEKIIAPPKLIDGISAMKILELHKPGPELGKALIALRTAQSDGEVKTPKQAETFLRKYRKNNLGP